MIEDVRKQEKDKQRLLWGALAVLSLPAVPILINDAVIDAAKSLWRKTKYLAEDKFGYVPKSQSVDKELYLKPEAPLYKWADDAAKEQGVMLRGIIMSPEDKGKPVINAEVGYFKNRAFITFKGDPMADDPSFTQAIIAHELGHFSAGENTRFSKIAMTTTSTYAWLAQATLSLGVIAQGMQTLPFVQNSIGNDLNPFSAVMLGVGAASLGAIRAASSLTSKFNHSVEHLSDLKASEIVGPEDTIGMLEKLNVRKEEKIAEFKRIYGEEPKIDWSKVTLRDVWHIAIGHLRQPMQNTHPTNDARQDFIRNAHGMTQDTQQVVSVAPAAKASTVGRNLPI